MKAILNAPGGGRRPGASCRGIVVTALFGLAAASAPGAVPGWIHYQGRISQGTNLVNGSVGLVLELYDQSSGGTPLFTDSNTVTVVDGLYSTILGDNPMQGSLTNALAQPAVYLQATVNGQALAPRERVLSVAYALLAAGTPPGAVTAAMLADGAVSGSKLATGAVGAAHIAVGAVGTDELAEGAVEPSDLSMTTRTEMFWNLNGNAGTATGTHFIGTSDNRPVEIRVNFNRALFIHPADGISPSLAAGCAQNRASAAGSVVAGGGDFLGPNTVDAPAGAILGGVGNSILSGGVVCSIGGGYGNLVGSGVGYGVIGGGMRNELQVGADYGAIGGGHSNRVLTGAQGGCIAGGEQGVIGAGASFAAVGGGRANTIGTSATNAVVGGGKNNTVGEGAEDAVIAGGAWNSTGPRAWQAVIGGGHNNYVGQNAYAATIAGGSTSFVLSNAYYGAVGGGVNHVLGPYASYATVGGGRNNQVGAWAIGASIGGGGVYGMPGWEIWSGNHVGASGGTIAGGVGNTIHTGALCSAVGGGLDNVIGLGATNGTIAGGLGNQIGADALCGFIGGGGYNAIGAGAWYAQAGGRRAKANHTGAFVWADSQNADFASTATNQFLVRASGGVGINVNNPATALHVGAGDLLVGGTNNFGMNSDARVILGDGNNYVKATWGQGLRFGVFQGIDALVLKNGGNVGIGTTDPTNKLQVAGTVQATAYITGSDREAKERIEAVHPAEILDKVAALPLATWTFKDDASGRHLGPMAQDFHAAFGLGNTDRGIYTVDADGVAFAAIQGLHAKLQEKEAQLARQQAEIDALTARLDALENRAGP